MSREDIRPNAMRFLDDEDRADNSLSKSERRVKIELNHTWMMRFLPVQIGKDQQYYVRLAQHWWNKTPHYCPRWLAPAWGGDPEYNCPVCAVSERLQESSSQAAREIGYDARVQLRRKMWVIVYDMQNARGDIDEAPLDELLNPYTFEMTKTTWTDFKKFQANALTRRRENSSPLGILDLETGCNVLATHTSKGTRLDRQDSSPIFDLNDPKWDEKIATIWSRVRQPNLILPSDDSLYQLSQKIEDAAEGKGRRNRRRSGDDGDDDRGGGGGGRSRYRSGGDDDDRSDYGRRSDSRDRRRSREDDDDAEPRSRRRSGEDYDDAPNDRSPDRGNTEDRSRASSREDRGPARDQRAPDADPDSANDPENDTGRQQTPTRRQAPRQEPEQPARQYLKENGDEEPRGQSVSAPPSRRGTSAPSGPPPARNSEVESKTHGVDAEELDRDQEPNPAPPQRRQGPPSARQQRQESRAGEDDDGDLAPVKQPARRAAQEQQGVDDEEDNAPAEKNDQAPAVRSQVEEAPPSVSATAPSPRRAAPQSDKTSDLKKRLDNLSNREK